MLLASLVQSLEKEVEVKGIILLLILLAILGLCFDICEFQLKIFHV